MYFICKGTEIKKLNWSNYFILFQVIKSNLFELCLKLVACWLSIYPEMQPQSLWYHVPHQIRPQTVSQFLSQKSIQQSELPIWSSTFCPAIREKETKVGILFCSHSNGSSLLSQTQQNEEKDGLKDQTLQLYLACTWKITNNGCVSIRTTKYNVSCILLTNHHPQ